ncbi:hypothetical protein D4R87_01885 [bacterium]|nr:MAG: hypothetical protein D4R87_01885 [bacterium]
MVNQQIVAWIKENEIQGFTHEQLYNSLVQQGYNTDEISEAFNQVVQSTNPVNQIKKIINKFSIVAFGVGAIVVSIIIIGWLVFSSKSCFNNGDCNDKSFCKDTTCIEKECMYDTFGIVGCSNANEFCFNYMCKTSADIANEFPLCSTNNDCNQECQNCKKGKTKCLKIMPTNSDGQELQETAICVECNSWPENLSDDSACKDGYICENFKCISKTKSKTKDTKTEKSDEYSLNKDKHIFDKDNRFSEETETVFMDNINAIFKNSEIHTVIISNTIESAPYSPNEEQKKYISELLDEKTKSFVFVLTTVTKEASNSFFGETHSTYCDLVFNNVIKDASQIKLRNKISDWGDILEDTCDRTGATDEKITEVLRGILVEIKEYSP